MKQLPEEKTLLELLELAKDAEQKAKELFEMATIMALKCEQRAERRLAANQKDDAIK